MVKQAYGYDLLVIGAGAAGSTAASNATQNGIPVALVQREKIVSTCLNYGCDATKSMIHVAGLLYRARQADRFGLRISEAKVDWTSVLSWVHQVQLRIRGGTSEEEAAQLSHEGINVLPGEATFVSPHELTIAGKTVSADRIIVAPGSQEVIPPIQGLNEAGFITNVEAVSLPTLPNRLAVVGGGAIGI